jgi:hypothetical protein
MRKPVSVSSNDKKSHAWELWIISAGRLKGTEVMPGPFFLLESMQLASGQTKIEESTHGQEQGGERKRASIKGEGS